jgi:hypothetical protein
VAPAERLTAADALAHPWITGGGGGGGGGGGRAAAAVARGETLDARELAAAPAVAGGLSRGMSTRHTKRQRTDDVDGSTVQWSCRGVGLYDAKISENLEMAWQQFKSGAGPPVFTLSTASHKVSHGW